MAEPKVDRRMIFIISLTFILSLCSLGYQQTLALALSDATDDFVLSQALTLGVFLLGMGLGSFLCERRRDSEWNLLLRVEWLLAICGVCSSLYVHLAESILSFINLGGPFALYVAVLPFVLLLGTFTGFELPLLLHPTLRGRLQPGHIFAANYAGAVAATVLVPIYMLPLLDVTGTAHTLGILNFVAASIIALRTTKIIAPFVIGLFIFLFMQISPKLTDLHLKTVYFSPHASATASLAGGWNVLQKLEAPIRQRSAYQWIDILPPEFSSSVQGTQDFQLYLDRKLQLSAGNERRYHESMVHGGINLLGRVPRRVLVLGGGDGLLAKNLLTYSEIEHIDLVEIDPAMIHLAKTQSDLRRLNGDSLRNPRITLHTTDAFQFVRRKLEPYDLVLIDLPFPVNYDLSLLFTKEFYALVNQRLQPSGVILLDFPLPGHRQDYLPNVIHTLKAAGFNDLFAFGTEDFFISAGHRPLAFDYPPLVSKVSNQTLTNLVSRGDDLRAAENTPARVNSVLFPLRFTHTQPRLAQDIRLELDPTFLPLFLQRFSDGFRSQTHFAQSEMPENLRAFWRESMGATGNFYEQISPGVRWPRFQWGIESQTEKGGRRRVVPFYQWFDFKNPGRLAQEWNKSFCFDKEKNWVGVAWTGDLSTLEFFSREGSGFKVRRYRDQKFTDEYLIEIDPASGGLQASHRGQILFAQNAVGRLAPQPRDPRAAELQFKLQREFLIFPRAHARSTAGEWERVYFP